MAIARAQTRPMARFVAALAFVAGVLAICPQPAAALTPERPDSPPLRVFRIGATGIYCVQLPCPTIGIIAETSLPGERPQWPLWSGKTDPPLSADPALTATLMGAWRAEKCQRVEGIWQNDTLAMRRILGACNLR